MLNLATMATTSHGLSVYINSCIKNPLISKSRTSETYPKGTLKQVKLSATDPSLVGDAGDEHEEEVYGLEKTMPVSASLQDVEDQLKALTEEQFYLKLQELKESNRKTLEECSKLYQAKYGGEGRAMGDLAAKELVDNMFAARLAARSGLVESAWKKPQQDDYGLTGAYDKDVALASRPPPVPAGRRVESLRKTSPARSSTAVPKPRPSSAPMYSDSYVRRSYSLDEQDWRRAMRASSDSEDEVQSEGPLDPTSQQHFDKIEGMWRGFRVDNYSPSYQRQRKEKSDLADRWHHRITIPKPFQMTLRDSAKLKSKTKAQEELEEKRQEKQRQEEEECQKKFKAQPAPAHIYLPLYDEIQEKNEARRQFVKENCKELLKSLEKPFNFVKREEEKKQQRMRNMTVAERIAQSVQKKNEKAFVAKPVPKSIYSDEPRDKLLEEEEYRKIRIKLRARELLHASSLPPNMEAQQKLKEHKEQEKLMKMKAQKKCSKQRPKSAHAVPDFDSMYREFQKDLARKKQRREATVVEPFSFQTSNLHSHHERVIQDMESNETLMKDTAGLNPRLSLGVLSSSLDSLPMRTTTTNELRTGYFRSLRERELRRWEEEQEKKHRRQIREAKLHKYIMERRSDNTRVDDALKDRLKKHRAAESARLEQYEKDMQEMKSRVEQRPLLFEKESQHNAGKAAEKKFQSTLKTAGVDEEFLHTRNFIAPSAGSDDNYEDDYEEEN